MFHIRIKFLVCIFVASLFTTLYAKPDRDLREKLARLFVEYDDADNEISKDHEQELEIKLTDNHRNNFQMPVKAELDLSEIFETTKRESGESGESGESEEISTTTTTTEKNPIIKVGIESLGSIITGFINLWNL